MSGATSIVSTYTTATTLAFSRKGIKLSAITDFIQRCGGRDQLEELTTDEVCEKYLKPMTLATTSSYCEMLEKEKIGLDTQSGRQIDTDQVQDAEIFVSHAWKYIFLDVVDALHFHFRKSPDKIIWFDLFSNNQHQACTLDFTWWSTTFRTAISEIGKVVMVLAPWHSPTPLTRAWCLYELYCVFSTGGKFEVAMAINQYQAFFTDITTNRNAIHNMISSIDAKNSECSKEEDRIKIFHAIETSVGFDGLNKLVISKMKDWVWDLLTQETVRTISPEKGLDVDDDDDGGSQNLQYQQGNNTHDAIVTLIDDVTSHSSFSNQLSNIYALFDPKACKTKQDGIDHLQCILDETIRRLLLDHSPFPPFHDLPSDDANIHCDFRKTAEKGGILSMSLLCCLGYNAVYDFSTRRGKGNLSEDMYDIARNTIESLLDSLFASRLSELNETSSSSSSPSSSSSSSSSSASSLLSSSSSSSSYSSLATLSRFAYFYFECTSKVSILIIIFSYLDRYYCKYRSSPSLENIRDDYFASKLLACLDIAEIDKASHKDILQYINFDLSMSTVGIEEKEDNVNIDVENNNNEEIITITTESNALGGKWNSIAKLLEKFNTIFPLTSEEFKKYKLADTAPRKDYKDYHDPNGDINTNQVSTLSTLIPINDDNKLKIVICNNKNVTSSQDIFLEESHPLVLLSSVLSNLVHQAKVGSTRILVVDIHELQDDNEFIFLKVMEYAEYHFIYPPVEIEKPLKSNNMADIVCEYDAKFLNNFSQEDIFNLILIANFIDFRWLLDLCCAKIASDIKGKSPSEIRETFNIENDFTPEEMLQIKEENRWCDES